MRRRKGGDLIGVGGKDTPMPSSHPSLRSKQKKKVRFEEPEVDREEEEGEEDMEEILELSPDLVQPDLGDASGPILSHQTYLQDIWLVDWNKQY